MAPPPPPAPRVVAPIPPSAPQAVTIRPVVGSTTFSPPFVNADGTVSGKMDQVGNNMTVTFSGNEEMASKKSKLFGSSANYTFTGQDMSQFPEWVAQFLSVPTYRAQCLQDCSPPS